MNTVAKGDKFEKVALEIITKLIDEGLFGIKQYLKVTSKAKVWSEQRKGHIEFDLMIQFFPPNSEKAMLTYFIECKNYKHRIPVDQVQKFYSDIIQVSGVNAKGIFISNSTFQKSAYHYADSMGMMIIQGNCADNFEIILHKRNSAYNSTIPMIKTSIDSNVLDNGLRSVEKMIDKQILQCLVTSNQTVSYGIDKLSKESIKTIASNELNTIGRSFINNANGLSIGILSEHLKLEHQIEIVHFSPNENSALGYCDIENKTIGISKSIVGTPRELFILGHEFGHYILHHRLFINQTLLDSFSDSYLDLSTGKHRLENPRHWIEWQANYFSISLLIPQSSLMARLWMTQGGKGNLYLDDQPVNQMKFDRIIAKLAKHFNVSKTSIIYRLKEFNLINDNSRVRNIRDLIEDYKAMYFN